MSEFPLVSCIMPTSQRRAFVLQSMKLFQAQDYPNKELIIVEDGGCSMPLGLSDNMLYTMQLTVRTIGEKRNIGVSKAVGEIICHWDDDDYYGQERLSKQVAPILAGRADVTAFRMTHLLDANAGMLWECSPDIHQALFGFDVRAGTLMYRASYLEEIQYLPISRGEDFHFLCDVLRSGARLEQVVSPASYICVRHGSNVTDALDVSDWPQVPIERYIPEEHRAFYASLRTVQVGA